jgi:hypothetical protein
MTATKITVLGDGTSVLETLDFRSEFVFNDFASWVCETLDVRPIAGEIREDMEPFRFEWNGSAFDVGWNEEHGCFVAATGERANLLREMQVALSS